MQSDDELRRVLQQMQDARMAGRPRTAALLAQDLVGTEDRDFNYEYGFDLRAGGLWQKAMVIHHRLATQHRDDADVKYAWAISQTVYGFPEGMLAVIDELQQKEPRKYRQGRAQILARLGRLREAVSELDRVLEEDPKALDAWLLLAEIAQRLHWEDRWRAALAPICQMALPGHVALWSFHGAVADGDFADAATLIQRSMELSPEWHSPFLANGRFLLSLYDSEQADEKILPLAEDCLKLATELAPDDGESLGWLLDLQTRKGAVDLTTARELAENRPYSGLPRFLARIAVYLSDDPTACAPLYRAWLERSPDDVEAWIELGHLLDGDEAENAFARAAEINPEFTSRCRRQ